MGDRRLVPALAARSVPACVAIVGALLASACDAKLSPGATLLQAAAETRNAGSARVSYVAVFDGMSEAGPLPLTGRGAFDYTHGLGRMTFDMTSLLRGPGAASEDAGRVEMIVDGRILYLRMPFLADVLPDDRPWIKVDLEAAAAAGRADLAQFTQLGQGDPTQFLELLRGVTRRVRDLGDEDVRGATTTHYATVLDLGRVAQEVSEPASASLQSLIARAGTSRIPADVWIDADGRMRKMSYELDLAPPAGGGTQAGAPDTMAVTMELFDFGVEVEVSVPHEDEVVDLLTLSQDEEGSP